MKRYLVALSALALLVGACSADTAVETSTVDAGAAATDAASPETGDDTSDEGAATAPDDPGAGTATEPAAAEPTPPEPDDAEASTNDSGAPGDDPTQDGDGSGATEGDAEATDSEVDPSPSADTAAAASFDLSELPDLVERADRAIGDSSIEPLGLAQEVVGFPLPITTTQDASLVGTSARLRTFQGEATWRYELWTLAGAPVGDVDIALDDNGAGAVELRDFYDPIMAELGFERRGSSASDPGDEGGPQLQTHIYSPLDPAWTVNGVPGTLDVARVTLDEDILGASFREELELVPGFRSEVEFTTPEGAAVPVPLLAAIAETIPVPADALLTGAAVQVLTRGPDSFDAERGLNYISVELEWELPEGSDFDQVLALFADPAQFDNPDVLTPGKPGFGGNADQLVPADSYVYNGTDLRQDTVLVGRYQGLLGVDAPDADEPIRITYRANLNPNDLELQPADS